MFRRDNRDSVRPPALDEDAYNTDEFIVSYLEFLLKLAPYFQPKLLLIRRIKLLEANHPFISLYHISRR
jgi:hypothetical protein